jgi:hypothetical protein
VNLRRIVSGVTYLSLLHRDHCEIRNSSSFVSSASDRNQFDPEKNWNFDVT